MTKVSVNLQDSFLNQVRKDNTRIKIILSDGTLLEGLVKGFDNFTVVINCNGPQHLVYKHAIAHIINDQKSLEMSEGRSPRPAQQQGGRRPEGGHSQGHPRQGRPAPAGAGEKFNAIDLSNLKMEEPEQTPAE